MARSIVFVLALAMTGSASGVAQVPASETPAALQAGIGKLGDFDHKTRTEAARTVRRAPAEVVVPMLAAAAKTHGDEYVRYRALTLLSGFGGDAAASVMAAVRGDRNDRLRLVAYGWFEHNPDPAILPSLIEALKKEDSEFVRPALTRALAAQLKDPRARDVLSPLVLKGADYFRGTVIDALGEYGGTFAIADLASVAELEGPLQDDAITALGRLGGASQVSLLARLQRTAPQQLQPTIAAALCLLDRACEETRKYLKESLAFAAGSSAYQSLLRGVVHGLGMLALRGDPTALPVLIDAGVSATSDTARSPIALGVGMVALKQPAVVLAALEGRSDLDAAIELFVDAFDMLAEDFEEERFYVAVRRAYWAAPVGSARRKMTEALIVKLEF
jgi:hypothetical protein